MELLKHFVQEADKYFIFKLKDKEIDEFLSKLPIEYRKCYITDEKIDEILQGHKKKANNPRIQITTKEIIQNKIPDPGSVMAGDFGEITSYFMLREKYLPKKMFDPRKWSWKTDRNKAMHHSDVILFHKNLKVSKDDLVVIAETKVKATATRRNPIQDAVDGINKDYTSRLAKTLTWLKEIYTTIEPDSNKIEFLDRFINSQENKYGEYTKHFKAIAIIDNSFLNNELASKIDDPKIDNLEIIIISIKNLKNTYEFTYRKMTES